MKVQESLCSCDGPALHGMLQRISSGMNLKRHCLHGAVGAQEEAVGRHRGDDLEEPGTRDAHAEMLSS